MVSRQIKWAPPTLVCPRAKCQARLECPPLPG
nr:MAG TPA: hypothetical protein [Caudoviricetes sp.]